MNNKVLLAGLGACFLFLVIYGFNSVYSVESQPAIKEPVVTKPIKPDNKIGIAHTEIFGVLERPQVVFDHNKHTEALKKEGKKEGETCDICHPLDKEKALILFDFPKKVKKKDKDTVMNAYHDECINCHKEKSQEK